MRKDLKRLYQNARRKAADRAGGERAFAIIGATYRQALMAQEILGVLYVQDSDVVPDSRVREMMHELYGFLLTDESLCE